MKSQYSYITGIVCSLFLHGAVIVGLMINWNPAGAKTIVQPQYISATLVELAPKQKTSKSKPEKFNISEQKKRDSNRRVIESIKRADALKKNQILKANKERKERERLEKERLQKLERERTEKMLLDALKRKQLQQDFDKSLTDEQARINTQEQEIEANSYRQAIQQRLSRNWSRPPSARLGMETMIRLQLVPTGRVVGVTVLESSGDEAFDRSVEQAALKAAPFEELRSMSPILFDNKFRQVDVLFSPEDLRL